MDCIPLGSIESLSVACYPRPSSRCSTLLAGLETAGVRGFLSAGNTWVPGLPRPAKVLGKGHSSVVAAVCHRRGIAAAKIRRADSKRASLAREARLLLEASRVGAAPRPLAWTSDFIVMELVAGPSLGEALRAWAQSRRHVELFLSRALHAAYALDQAMILHRELSRPQRHVLFTGDPTLSAALIVDLESAAPGKCGNLNRITQYAARVLGASISSISELLARYKREGCPRSLYLDILERLFGQH